MKVCAGLDLSLTNAGIAIIKSKRKAEYYSYGYSLNKTSTDRDRLERVAYISKNILSHLKDVDYIGVENYGFSSKGQLTSQAELAGLIKGQLIMDGKTPAAIAVKTIRKFLVGSGNASKSDLQNHLVGLGYARPNNFDESDALGVAEIINRWVNYREEETCAYVCEIFGRLDNNQLRTFA